ncbi:MAG: transcription termination factor Rho [Chloroflexi bacterium]|nr:transcription termination factor Rho [Chloroflexota bacterium]MCI0783973.1 transcription termination factor Rho [Chloroflexota bacterium]MCI0817249.1 transcription termination factor Rho [Chloroflexota bacterium]MCI0819975.1 transcription termination factor Rho [Chloroflexota bacterium]MCI0832395.1 transcription termination factor Rho [Chloroflexota bacterium]
MSLTELETKTKDELLDVAKEMGVSASGLRKQDLVFKIMQARAEGEGNYFAGGILEMASDGFGFLRTDGLSPSLSDVYVSQTQIRRFALRSGDYVMGAVRQPKDSEKYYGLLRVDAINGLDPETAKKRPYFEQLTPIFPDEMLNLEEGVSNLSTRVIDLIAPVGRGQRGLIVSPPKAGKTILLKTIAAATAKRYEDIYIIVVLIGERPEEVTDWQRSVTEAEVVAATFDDPVAEQTRVAELALERAKRLVEGGRHVLVLLDGITRLTRAYNLALPSSGRTLSGGIDPVALHPPKRLFGAARNVENGGSLTILATCLVDTGSRMDEVIFEEFKGTGNWELWLDRRLAEKRVYPSIDIQKSGTRRDDLLLDEETHKRIVLLRRMTSLVNQSQNSSESTEMILDRLSRTETNAEFLATLKEAL